MCICTPKPSALNDLTGTDVTSVDLDLAGALGGTAGDGQIDRVVVNGTDADDAFTVAGAEVSGRSVAGLRDPRP